MAVKTVAIQVTTRGNADMLDVTEQVAHAVAQSEIHNGVVTAFTPSATSAFTTIEYEPGCLSDLRRLFDEIVPAGRLYDHNEKWGDGNGHAHIRSALLGPSLTIPFVDGRLTLGTWQQIIFVDFDNRSRRRELVIQIIGE